MVKFDTFTKVLLVVIAVFLGMIALRPIFYTEVAQANPGRFDNIDFAVALTEGAFVASFFDRSSGEVWLYDFSSGQYKGMKKLTSLGQNMTK